MKKLACQKVKMFKIKNRKGYACICQDNLTEGKTPYQAYLRMAKAQKRSGLILQEIDSGRAKRLVKSI